MPPCPARPLPRLVLLALLALLLNGCAATLVPPPAPQDPRPVTLLTHARHSTLLLTDGEAERVRWAYADWAWYVDGEQGIGSGARALFAPSPAALGRQRIAAADEAENLEQATGVGIDRAFRFEVEAARVDALLDALERQFAAAGPPRRNESLNLSLVPHPRPYTFAYNSNHMVADWLRELGVEVRGNPAVGRWRVRE